MAFKLKENVPTTFTFPFGDFEEKEGDYGPQWMYAVNVDGQKDYLYTNKKLHDALQAAHVAKGSTLTVTLTKDGRTNIYTVTGGTTGYAPPAGGTAKAVPRPAGSPTFADVSFAYRECLFAASAYLTELSEFAYGKPDQPAQPVELSVVQAAAATMMIQCEKSGCMPRVPKTAPNLDGEHTKAFLAWLTEYRARPDVATLWQGGKGEWAAFIQKAASKDSMADVAGMNDPVAYEMIKTLVLAETAARAEAAKEVPMESGEADVPF